MHLQSGSMFQPAMLVDPGVCNPLVLPIDPNFRPEISKFFTPSSRKKKAMPSSMHCLKLYVGQSYWTDGSEIRRENQLIWWISHCLWGFIHVRWLLGFLPSTICVKILERSTPFQFISHDGSMRRLYISLLSYHTNQPSRYVNIQSSHGCYGYSRSGAGISEQNCHHTVMPKSFWKQVLSGSFSGCLICAAVGLL